MPAICFIENPTYADGNRWEYLDAFTLPKKLPVTGLTDDEKRDRQTVPGKLALTHDRRGVVIRLNPAHILNSTAGAPTAAKTPNLGDDSFIVTAAMEMDTRLKVTSNIRPGIRRVLTIHVPGAKFWYIAPNTVVGVDGAGELLRFPGAQAGDPTLAQYKRGVLRNDAFKLFSVMAIARAWLGQDRYNVVATVKNDGITGLGPRGGMQPGQLLSQIDRGLPGTQATPVGTLVTNVIYDNSDEATVRVSIQTGDANINPVHMIKQAGL